MLYGRLLYAPSETGESQLTEMERELRSKLAKAKAMATEVRESASGKEAEGARSEGAWAASGVRVSCKGGGGGAAVPQRGELQ
jgi:hypothetical protein